MFVSMETGAPAPALSFRITSNQPSSRAAMRRPEWASYLHRAHARTCTRAAYERDTRSCFWQILHTHTGSLRCVFMQLSIIGRTPVFALPNHNNISAESSPARSPLTPALIPRSRGKRPSSACSRRPGHRAKSGDVIGGYADASPGRKRMRCKGKVAR